MSTMPFESFLATIERIGDAVATTDPDLEVLMAGAQRLQSLAVVSVESLAAYAREEPRWVRLLGLAVGLSQESLLVTMNQLFGTRSYRIAAKRAPELVSALDELGLLERLSAERSRPYDYSDILLARYESRATAGRAIGRGRLLEDVVESVVESLGLPHQMRTSFVGQGGRTAPCDLAIPIGGPEARMVVGIKGFNSTGSKLTDARREIEEMALVRKARQMVFVVVDGSGWVNRRSDLRAIHALLEQGEVDGLYTRRTMSDLASDLSEAARALRVLPLPTGVDPLSESP